jgi:hypothetical protein
LRRRLKKGKGAKVLETSMLDEGHTVIVVKWWEMSEGGEGIREIRD